MDTFVRLRRAIAAFDPVEAMATRDPVEIAGLVEQLRAVATDLEVRAEFQAMFTSDNSAPASTVTERDPLADVHLPAAIPDTVAIPDDL